MATLNEANTLVTKRPVSATRRHVPYDVLLMSRFPKRDTTVERHVDGPRCVSRHGSRAVKPFVIIQCNSSRTRVNLSSFREQRASYTEESEIFKEKRNMTGIISP